MGLVRDVSPFHLRDLNFLGTVWLVVLFVVFLFGLGVVFVVWLLVWFASPTDEIFYSFELCANSMQS